MINKFTAIKPNELTRKEKEVFWAGHFVSGSMIKRIMEEPVTLLQEKWGLIPKTIPGENPDVRQHTNDWTKAVMIRGTYFEDGIINMANDKIDGIDLDNIKIDKRTFQGENTVYTANIDGFTGKDIDNIDDIVEVKYSSTTNLNTLLQRYVYQIMFYMWFFNVKKGAHFLVYQEKIESIEFCMNGKRFPANKCFPRLITKYIPRDKGDEAIMLAKIDVWVAALKTMNIELITWGDGK